MDSLGTLVQYLHVADCAPYDSLEWLLDHLHDEEFQPKNTLSLVYDREDGDPINAYVREYFSLGESGVVEIVLGVTNYPYVVVT